MAKVGISLAQITADSFNASTKDTEKIGDIPIVEVNKYSPLSYKTI